MTTNEFLREKARERDRFELDLGDAFDVKASIVLLILTFLGTISATMLTADRLTPIPKLAQIPVVAFIVISGMFCGPVCGRRIICLTTCPKPTVIGLRTWENPIPSGSKVSPV